MGDPFSFRRHAACVPLALLVGELAALTPAVRAPPAADEEPKVTLHPGDPAPKLSVSKWLKGSR